jgi:predicted metal-dependent hydrolase
MAAALRMQKHPQRVERALLVIDGDVLPLTFKRNVRARRIILRLDRSGRGVQITLPLRASRLKALDFAKLHSDWIKSRIARIPERIVFMPGAVIPLRGVPHEIRHGERLRGLVRVMPPGSEGTGIIEIAGEMSHLARRCREWLKAQAKKELAAASEIYARAMGVSFSKIAIRDQASRWGSCSTTGQLSYSWRLILAPPFVLDYVAAHEVAHLKHMNHGARFWRLVKGHCPEVERARAWMRANGRLLHSYDA